MDDDIVSTSSEILEKFIRELHGLTNYVKNSIMPIRGKIVNAFTTSTKKYFENAEVAGLFKIMGFNGYSKKFDMTKFKPEKIVIATDADPDGDHIRSLVLGMFLRYLPEAIEMGKVYSATPPLYGISLGKNKMKFFANNVDYIEYVQNLFCKENIICNATTKKEYTKKDITKIIYNNMDYIKMMNHVSLTYAIDPYLLEFILYNRMLNFKKFKAAVEKTYKFCTVSNENGTTMIRGLVGSAYQTVFFNQRLIDSCKEIISLIDKSAEYYIINGKVCTLYEFMMLFNSFEPKNLTRYKGLGET